MRRIRMIIGVVLMMLAIAGLIYWEVAGREALLTEPVLAAAKNIPAGKVVTASDFKIIGVLEESRVQGAISPNKIEDIVGRKAKQLIPLNAQVTAGFFKEDLFRIPEGKSVFVIPKEWISMRSSSLRRQDWIAVYPRGSKQAIGIYQVAFVKDEKDVEVEGTKSETTVLSRTSGTATISHVEIIADAESFCQMTSTAESGSGGLLLVQVPEPLR